MILIHIIHIIFFDFKIILLNCTAFMEILHNKNCWAIHYNKWNHFTKFLDNLYIIL